QVITPRYACPVTDRIVARTGIPTDHGRGCSSLDPGPAAMWSGSFFRRYLRNSDQGINANLPKSVPAHVCQDAKYRSNAVRFYCGNDKPQFHTDQVIPEKKRHLFPKSFDHFVSLIRGYAKTSALQHAQDFQRFTGV